MSYRIGLGYDVHAFSEERELIIGGVNIPSEAGLAGHSDADVLLHAIADAILGAAALGDIGTHFPDTDQAFKNADSMILLAEVRKLLNQNEFQVINVDATIVAETPRMSPYIDQMRKRIKDCLQIQKSCVSIKATTSEKMGFIGKNEGIAVHAVVMIKKV